MNSNDKMHFLVYKITNLLDGKIYIGKHQTTNVNDTYFGSGTYLWKAIDKYGIQNFKKEILFDFDTEEEMLAKERELVDESFIARDDTYNLCLGGGGQYTRKRGNHGTHDTFRRLNAIKHRYICNPYTHKRLRLYKDQIPDELIAQGWEFGSLSKAATTFISNFDNTQISIRNFARQHALNENLALKRYENNWSLNEIITIPECQRLVKDPKEHDAILKQKKLAAAESRKQRQQKINEQRKKEAYQYFKEYQQLGRDGMNEKYSDSEQRHSIYKLMRFYVKEYKTKNGSCKSLDIECMGRTQSLNKWSAELHVPKATFYARRKKYNKSFRDQILEILQNQD